MSRTIELKLIAIHYIRTYCVRVAKVMAITYRQIIEKSTSTNRSRYSSLLDLLPIIRPLAGLGKFSFGFLPSTPHVSPPAKICVRASECETRTQHSRTSVEGVNLCLLKSATAVTLVRTKISSTAVRTSSLVI
jgi:hypothetical protein